MPPPLRVLVVEDEPLALQRLLRFTHADDRLRLEGFATDGAAAVALIDRVRPDLLFLDVELPECSGLAVLERVTHMPAVIFTTAWAEYAVAAFELDAVDYLVKPFGVLRFTAAVDRILRRMGERPVAGGRAGVERILVSHSGQLRPVKAADVIRIEGAGDYVRIHTRAEVFLAQSSLAELESRLDPGRFVRVHRTQIVNIDFVTSILNHDSRRLRLVLSNGDEVVASRAGSQTLRALRSSRP